MGNNNSCENGPVKKPPRGSGGKEWEVVRGGDVSNSSAAVFNSPVSNDDDSSSRLEFEINASPLDLEKALYRQDEEDVNESETKDDEAVASDGKYGSGGAAAAAAVPTEVTRTPQQRAIIDSQKWKLRVYNRFV